MEKKKNIVLVLLFIIIAVMACFGVKMSKEIFDLKRSINDNTNVNQNNNQEQNNNQQNENSNQKQQDNTPKELTASEVEPLLEKLRLLYKGTTKATDEGISMGDNIYEDKIVKFDNYNYNNGLLVAFFYSGGNGSTDNCSVAKNYQFINNDNKQWLNNLCDNNILEYEKSNLYLNDIPIREVYNTNYQLIDTAYKKIFGQSKYIPKTDLTINGPIYCRYINNDLLCFSTDGGYTSNFIETSFINATKNNDEIIIYENVKKDNVTKKYKTTFKLDNDNNYYWYSTEPVN